MTLDEALARYPGAETFQFGGGPAQSAEILALVRAGKKTVTCEALSLFEARGEPLPEVGRTDIVLDGAGAPACAVRTVEVMRIPFDEMPAVLVPDQGEFRDLAQWRKGYRAELTEAGVFDPKVMLVVERFELVEDFGEAADG